jgi:tRNA dimethylallyltransferase
MALQISPKQHRFWGVAWEHQLKSRSVIVAGPTAVGKTDLSILLAQRLGGEIINADSMQVYRGMNIGTAKPSAQEVHASGVRFHLIDVVAPDEPFTVSAWCQLANAAVADVFSRSGIPVLCGGTGMYLRSFVQNWSLAETPRNDEIREQLNREATLLGSQHLHQQLAAVDPEAAARLHQNDKLRIVRALEVFLASGVSLSEHHRRDREGADLTDQTPIFVINTDRETLYQRINQRVDLMMSSGLEDEVSSLLSAGYEDFLPSMRGLGYKEICAYFRGETTRSEASEQIKLNTRRYAKRQLTWFRGESNTHWIDLSIRSIAQAVEAIQAYVDTGVFPDTSASTV